MDNAPPEINDRVGCSGKSKSYEYLLFFRDGPARHGLSPEQIQALIVDRQLWLQSLAREALLIHVWVLDPPARCENNILDKRPLSPIGACIHLRSAIDITGFAQTYPGATDGASVEIRAITTASPAFVRNLPTTRASQYD